MKEINKKYKDTFNNIKLDDKKINNNMYKILNKKNKNKIVLLLRYAVVLLIALVITISGSAYVIANKTNNKIEDLSDDTKMKFVFHDEIIDKIITENQITKKDYEIEEAEEFFGHKVLRLNDGQEYYLEPILQKKSSDNKIDLIKLFYRNKKNEIIYNKPRKYSVQFVWVYFNYDGKNHGIESEGMIKKKERSDIYVVNSTNKDLEATVFHYSDTNYSEVYFVYDGLTYHVSFRTYSDDVTHEESTKYTLDCIQDALDNIFVEEI